MIADTLPVVFIAGGISLLAWLICWYMRTVIKRLWPDGAHWSNDAAEALEFASILMGAVGVVAAIASIIAGMIIAWAVSVLLFWSIIAAAGLLAWVKIEERVRARVAEREAKKK